MQASKKNINDIMKIKETFLKLFFQKVLEIYKILDNIINSERVIVKLNAYIANINRLLKEVKSNISADYICSNSKEIIIITNKIAITLDQNIIEKYMKKLNEINTVNLY